MSETPVTQEFSAIVADIAATMNVPADRHGDLVQRLAVDLPAYARWSPQLTPRDTVKQKIAELLAQDIAASLAAAKPPTPEADGKMCGVDKSVWNRLSPQDRLSLYRTWNAKTGVNDPKADSPKARKPNVKRIEAELHAAHHVARRLRGAEAAAQAERIKSLTQQLKEARDNG